MNSEESKALAQFCADQYYAFDARAWKRRSQYDHHASTLAALYLSMTSWYGHESELERVAADARALNDSGDAFRLEHEGRFDPAQFSTMVRSEIAKRHLPTAEIPARREPRGATA